ncbi:hypothetical protein QBC33DRAFT_515190 [Phialemonium atrogriseum]|uniref:Uncharacterized protein n=1 Tax=Phialemonium atrogriseum TaxID=1093897 RepID=A0AAJ0FFX3_9PEZI|nr:uncharacterized protein QBC33DRAFT_515190 [Phialemonium atrogriseum]KAK1767006.1 hypothetical protein QBC33DRAFT_515190 [Phialemonium atrogriseum]
MDFLTTFKWCKPMRRAGPQSIRLKTETPDTTYGIHVLVPTFTMIRPTSEGPTVLSETFLWRGQYPTIWSRDIYFGAGGHSGDRTRRPELGKPRKLSVNHATSRLPVELKGGNGEILASLVCLVGGLLISTNYILVLEKRKVVEDLPQ